MIYNVTHTTAYEYTHPVSVSYHILRLHPRAMARQTSLAHEFVIDPRPVLTQSRVDYFGNELTFATIEGTHTRLSVTSRSHVEVHATASPKAAESPAWEE